MRATNKAFLIGSCLMAFAGCAAPPAKSPPVGAQGGLAKIQHVIVIYAENRSFDNLYGLFPGAYGIARARPATWTQSDRDGTPLRVLPPVWKSGNTADPAYPANLPNQPFHIDAPPINQPLPLPHATWSTASTTTRMQINGGKNDMFAAWSDAGGLAMGYYDGCTLPLWKLARQYTLADNFFMGAFGGSFLNHFWLICACTPVFQDAPEHRLIAALDANGKLALSRFARERPGRPARNTSTTAPDARRVRGEHAAAGLPAERACRLRPAATRDWRTRQSIRCRRRPRRPSATALGQGDRVGVVCRSLGTPRSPTACSRRARPARSSTTRRPVRRTSRRTISPSTTSARYAPGTAERARRLKDYSDLLAQIAGRHATRRGVLQATGEPQRAPRLHRRSLRRRAHRRRGRAAPGRARSGSQR